MEYFTIYNISVQVSWYYLFPEMIATKLEKYRQDYQQSQYCIGNNSNERFTMVQTYMVLYKWT